MLKDPGLQLVLSFYSSGGYLIQIETMQQFCVVEVWSSQQYPIN